MSQASPELPAPPGTQHSGEITLPTLCTGQGRTPSTTIRASFSSKAIPVFKASETQLEDTTSTFLHPVNVCRFLPATENEVRIVTCIKHYKI